MSGNNKKIWLIALILLIILVGVLSFGGGSKPSSAPQPVVANTAPSNAPSSQESPVNDSTVFPIPRENPNVKAIFDRPDSVRYLFTGIIKGLKNEPAGMQVSFTEQSPALPSLFLIKATIVARVVGPGKFETASLDDLKPGVKVDLGVDYSKTKKQWVPLVREAYFYPTP